MTDLFAFDGATYEPKRDYVRLRGQLARVYNWMQDGEWWTLDGLQFLSVKQGYHDTQAAISARIRDLRKSKFGGHTVEREHVAGGLWRYRLKSKG